MADMRLDMQEGHLTTTARQRMRRTVCAVLAGGGIVAAAITTGAGAAAPGAGGSSVQPSLPRAETWSERGVDPGLVGAAGMLRVRLLLRDQALLSAASAPDIQEQLQLDPLSSSRRAAADHPGGITEAEKSSALRAEASYEASIEESTTRRRPRGWDRGRDPSDRQNEQST